MIQEGATLPLPLRKLLHEKIGRELPMEVYQQSITGRRILVAPQPVTEKQGVLFIPRSAVERKKLQMGAGWVISCGPLVGTPIATPAGSVLCEHPSDLIGKRILYKAYTGVSLNLEDNEDEWGGPLVVMTDCDILAIGEGL